MWPLPGLSFKCPKLGGSTPLLMQLKSNMQVFDKWSSGVLSFSRHLGATEEIASPLGPAPFTTESSRMQISLS